MSRKRFFRGHTVAWLGFALLVSGCDRGGPPAATSAPAVQGACAKHGLTPDKCPFCNPAIIKEQGECGEHGVPEALCSRCRPFLVAAFKAENDWCAEHDVPESQCVLCNPELAKATPAAAMPPKQIELVAATDEQPRSTRPPSVTCKNNSLRVRFNSPGIAKQAGLEFEQVERRPLTATVTCNAALAYDGNHYARVTPRAPGIVREVGKDLGDAVKAGDVLAVIESAELASATAEYLAPCSWRSGPSSQLNWGLRSFRDCTKRPLRSTPSGWRVFRWRNRSGTAPKSNSTCCKRTQMKCGTSGAERACPRSRRTPWGWS